MTGQAEPAPHAPFDISLEQAVLGAMLADNALIDPAAEILDAEHFYDPMHGRIFDMAVYLLTEGAVTPLIMRAVMKTDPGIRTLAEDDLESGRDPGFDYFAQLMGAAPAQAPIRQFATMLRDLADRRAMIKLGEDLARDATLPPTEAKTADLADRAQQTLDAVIAGSGKARSRRPVAASAAAWAMMRAVEGQAVADRPVGVKTGISKIDKATGGFLPSTLWVVGGRPGMGKSIVATNWGRQAAEQGIPVDYDSGEMGQAELAARLGCDVDFDRCAADRLDPMPYQDFVHLKATAGQIERMTGAALHLQGLEFDIFDLPGMTLEWIEGSARRRARQRPGHRLLIIDHLQLVTWEGAPRGTNRNTEQTEITKRLKAVAKELGWTVLLLSQLSREIEKRDDKHPQSSDLREGGSVEQDADVIIGIMRPLRYAKDAIRFAKNAEQRSDAILKYDAAIGVMEMAVLKNRSGPEVDYFKAFVDEKASALRNRPDQADEEPTLMDHANLAAEMNP